MSLLGGLISTFLGYKDDKKVNKMSAEQLAIQKQLTDQQVSVSKYMQELAHQAAGLKGTFTDAYGGGAHQNADGSWSSSLSDQQKPIQDASYQEELNRATHDQQIRRQALDSAESARQRSAYQATGALDDINAFKRGVGRVDEGRLASTMHNDRVGAVNAGYDDAARAATTLQLRTGNGAIGDALTTLARNRVRDNAQVGSTQAEAMTTAQQVNNQRSGQLYDIYSGFNKEGTTVPDIAFNPATYNQDAYNKLSDAMKFDLNKLDVAMGGSGQAGSTLNNAATGSGNAFTSYLNNRIANPTGKFIGGVDTQIGNALQGIFSGGMSFGG